VLLARSALACVPALVARFGAPPAPSSAPRCGHAAAIGAALVFAVASGQFVRLVVRTESTDLASQRGDRTFQYAGTIHYEEVQATYQEYLGVPGFKEKKKRLAIFLRAWTAAQRSRGPESSGSDRPRSEPQASSLRPRPKGHETGQGSC
jgi:hypothetical protein